MVGMLRYGMRYGMVYGIGMVVDFKAIYNIKVTKVIKID